MKKKKKWRKAMINLPLFFICDHTVFLKSYEGVIFQHNPITQKGCFQSKHCNHGDISFVILKNIRLGCFKVKATDQKQFFFKIKFTKTTEMSYLNKFSFRYTPS